MTRSRLVCLLCILLAAPGEAAEDFAVEAERRDDALSVRARATLRAPGELVWQVITDYEALPRFVPGLSRSRVIERSAGRVMVEQSGEARFLFFSFPIETRLEVHEFPRHRIVSRAVAGNLRRLEGRYELEHNPPRGTVTLRYIGTIEPDFALPPLFGMAAMRSVIEDQFGAMVTEIERRAAQPGVPR